MRCIHCFHKLAEMTNSTSFLEALALKSQGWDTETKGELQEYFN